MPSPTHHAVPIISRSVIKLALSWLLKGRKGYLGCSREGLRSLSPMETDQGSAWPWLIAPNWRPQEERVR